MTNPTEFSQSIRQTNNKYHAVEKQCRSGHRHDSIFEAGYCDQLRILTISGKVLSYEVQKPFEIVVNGRLICKHIIDFLVTYKDGRVEAHETKGMETPAWKIKMKLFTALYPEIPYIVVKKQERRTRCQKHKSLKGFLETMRKESIQEQT